MYWTQVADRSQVSLPGHDADWRVATSSTLPTFNLYKQVHQRREVTLYSARVLVGRRPTLDLEHLQVLRR